MGREYHHEVQSLSEEAKKYVWEKTRDDWLEEHTAAFAVDPGAPDAIVLAMGIGEMERNFRRMESDLDRGTLPLETAMQTRLRIMAVGSLIERIRTRCFAYASRMEIQLRPA
jgi:hypothetical protein